MKNPLLHIVADIPFDRIKVEHIKPAIAQLLEQAKEKIEHIYAKGSKKDYEHTLGALDDATENLEYAAGIVDHLESVVTSPALREAYNETRPQVSAFWSWISSNSDLYAAVEAFAATDEAKKLNSTRARFLKKTLADFRRQGAKLAPAQREVLRKLDIALSEVTTKFSQNALDSTNAFELIVTDEKDLAGLPERAKIAAREDAAQKNLEGWRFTLQAPSVQAVLMHLDNAKIREKIWTAYNQRASGGATDNKANIERTLELRKQKAQLLGYKDFSDLVLEDRMAKNGQKAADFNRDLTQRTEPAFEREKKELRAFRQKLERKDNIEAWDVAYYAEKQRKALYDFDDEELRAYFPLEQVLNGLFSVVRKLYGIKIETHSAPTWHPDVRVYAMRDEQEKLIATFYADFFPRDTKRDGAWMNAFITHVAARKHSLPNVGLICANVQPPTKAKPALLSHTEVETIFHEFGHLLHHCLSNVSVRTLSGTNVAWDFVELPSQIMENWCWEREVLDLFARHYESGAAIPDELFQKMTRARIYRAATAQMRQLGFAEADLALHRDYDPTRDGDPVLYANRILQKHMPSKLPEGYSMFTSFGHVFADAIGYAAGYYSYKWAEVLDADAFSRFKREGVFNPKTAQSFRDTILSKGNSQDPAQLYREFMGREPNLDALLERFGLLQSAQTH